MTQPQGSPPALQRTPLSADETARAEANFVPYVAEALVAKGRFRVTADSPDMVELFQKVARRAGDVLQRPVVSYANGREIVITFGHEAPGLALLGRGAGQLVECIADGLPKRVMSRTEREFLARPALLRIQPDRAGNQLLGLPLEAGPYMRVQEGVGVAEDLQVPRRNAGSDCQACPLDHFAESVHVRQEGHPLVPRQV